MSKTTGKASASNKIQRRAFVADLLKHRGSGLVVTGLGSPTWDLFAAGDQPENLYSWGGMGLAVPTALGLAMAQPSRRVLAMTGDGEMMMGIGSLGVVADQAPENLSILVLDNERFSETGRQRGLTGNRTDLCAVAKGFGIKETMFVTEVSAIPSLAKFLFETKGPVFAVAKIALSEDPWRLPEKDGAAIARRFKISLGLEKA
ncbi:MAG: aldehyde dehydrogenase [Proteobacteria bacterium]|nr:aldehyde dehydrogenase [Pseudomonadota bacterium]